MDKGNHFIIRLLSESLKLLGFNYTCPVQKGHYERLNWKIGDHSIPRVVSIYSKTRIIGFSFNLFAKAKVKSVKSMINLFRIAIIGIIDQSGK